MNLATVFCILLGGLFGDGTKPTIAILPFPAASIDSNSQQIFLDALSNELVKTSKVRVIERSQINAILAEQGFQNSGACNSSECAVEVGKIASAHYIALGSIRSTDSSISIAFRLVSVENAEIFTSSQVFGDKANTEFYHNAAKRIAFELVSFDSPHPNPTHRIISDKYKNWEKYHSGLHPRFQILLGAAGITETPIGGRFGIEYNGFGALVGIGPSPILGSAIHEALNDDPIRTRFTPTLSLFIAWNNKQISASYCSISSLNSESDKTYTINSYALDYEIDLGKPRNFGLLLGAGIIDLHDERSDEAQKLPQAHIALLWQI